MTWYLVWLMATPYGLAEHYLPQISESACTKSLTGTRMAPSPAYPSITLAEFCAYLPTMTTFIYRWGDIPTS